MKRPKLLFQMLAAFACGILVYLLLFYSLSTISTRITSSCNRCSFLTKLMGRPPVEFGVMNKINLATVAAAGAVDGINPCAFTVMVFFISFLKFLGRKKGELLLAGAIFTLSVFCAYIVIGLGVFQVLRSLDAFLWVSKFISFGIGFLALGLGVLSYSDYLKLKNGESSGIVLKLPSRINKLIHQVIRSNNTPFIMVGAAVSGFFVSFLELVCTGQVYLPTLVFILNTPFMAAKALTFLIIYNIMFILPLVAVFILAYFGATSEWFHKITNRNLPLVKLLTAILFIGLGLFLFLNKL